MENAIIIAVLALILGAAAIYLIRARKRGQACVGCPHSGSCCSCGCSSKKGKQ